MKKLSKIILVRWLLGLWAVGLGFRYSLELGLAETHISVPKYFVNIWFDFVPLCVLGLVVTVYETYLLYKGITAKEKKPLGGD